MPSREIVISIPKRLVTNPSWKNDEYLLNQLAGINDSPEEENMPFRQWLLFKCHEALAKDPKLVTITLRAVTDKSDNTRYTFKFTEED